MSALSLLDLDATFLKRIDPHHWQNVETLAEADGVEFLCPKCFAENEGPIGTHAVVCWSPDVPQDTSPTPGRWQMQGATLADLTLVAGSSSVLLTGGCQAHFFVRNGQIENC